MTVATTGTTTAAATVAGTTTGTRPTGTTTSETATTEMTTTETTTTETTTTETTTTETTTTTRVPAAAAQATADTAPAKGRQSDSSQLLMCAAASGASASIRPRTIPSAKRSRPPSLMSVPSHTAHRSASIGVTLTAAMRSAGPALASRAI